MYASRVPVVHLDMVVIHVYCASVLLLRTGKSCYSSGIQYVSLLCGTAIRYYAVVCLCQLRVMWVPYGRQTSTPALLEPLAPWQVSGLHRSVRQSTVRYTRKMIASMNSS